MILTELENFYFYFYNRLANFSISNTGQITVIGELDRESIDDEQGQIKFIVMAIDHGHLPLTGTTEVTVKVVDANDNCPYFNTQDHNFTYVFKELARPHNFHKIEVIINLADELISVTSLTLENM